MGWGYGLVCKSLAMQAWELELDFQNPHKIIWHGGASFNSQHWKAGDEHPRAFEADELLIEGPIEGSYEVSQDCGTQYCEVAV